MFAITVFYCIVLATADNYADVCDNDSFIIGKHAPLAVTLADRMKTQPLTVDEMKLVVLRLAEAMKFLHERDIVHGCLDTSLVSLDIVEGV